MSNIIPNASAVEQPIERRYSSSNGWQTIRRWRGGEEAIVAQGDLQMSQGYEIIVRAGPVWELEATIGGNTTGGGGIGDEPVEVWELTGNAFEKDILNADIDAVAGLHKEDYRVLRDFFDGKKDAEQYKTTSPVWRNTGGAPESIWQCWLAGAKSIQMYQPILRHTKTIARGAEVPQSVVGAGQIYSTTKVIELNFVPGWLAISLPASANRSRPGETVPTLYYGWLKAYPQITLAAFGKSQIIQEWQFGLWAWKMYEVHE